MCYRGGRLHAAAQPRSANTLGVRIRGRWVGTILYPSTAATNKSVSEFRANTIGVIQVSRGVNAPAGARAMCARACGKSCRVFLFRFLYRMVRILIVEYSVENRKMLFFLMKPMHFGGKAFLSRLHSLECIVRGRSTECTGCAILWPHVDVRRASPSIPCTSIAAGGFNSLDVGRRQVGSRGPGRWRLCWCRVLCKSQAEAIQNCSWQPGGAQPT